MSACRALGLSYVMLCLATAPLRADDPIVAQQMRIRVVQSGGDSLLTDLKDIVTSTPNKGLQKEWKNLNEILDGFLLGIHREQPLRVDLVIAPDDSGTVKLGYEPSFPIDVNPKTTKEKFEGKDSFLENVKGLGYKVKKQPAGDLYEMVESGVKGAKPFYMRHLHGYAIISQSAKALPATLPDPKIAVQPLLAAGYDVAAELTNDAAGMAGRKASFDSLRKELEASIKFKRGEDKSEFELRKLGVVQFFDELQRFAVESEKLLIGWTTLPGAKDGKGELLLSAIAGSDLQKSIQLLSVQPSYFANVKLHPQEVLSGKMLFPFDPMRKEHALVRHPLLQTVTNLQIDKSTTFTAEGKVAAKQALDHLIQIFNATVDVGLDGFIDLHAAENGAQTGVAGLLAGKAKLVDDIVGLLPKISPKWSVKLNAEQHGGVTIHEVTISEKYKEEFAALFGKETVFYVGTSDKAVWAAAGVNSLAELKAAIDDQAQPAPEKPDPVFASITMKFGPLVKLIDEIEKKIPVGENPPKQEVQQRKERDRIRFLALEAFEPGTEQLTGKMSLEGETVKGELSINEGIFKFLGSAIADFSKQNLR